MRPSILILIQLALASVLSADPVAPQLEISQPTPGTLQLEWSPDAEAAAWDLFTRGSGAGWSFLGRSFTTSVAVPVNPQPDDLRLYRAVALSDVPAPGAPVDGLVAWYPLGGNGLDASGNGLHLDEFLAQWGSGHLGGSVSLGETENYLERAAALQFEPGFGGWTVSLWAYAGEQPPHGMAISWYRCGADPACTSTDSAVYQLSIGAGVPAWMVRDNDATVTLVTAPDALQEGGWHLIVGVIGSDRLTRLYVDGELVGTSLESLGGLHHGGTNVPLSVGRVYRTGWGTPGNYLTGQLDEIRVYDRALSPDEIRSMHAEGGWPFSP